MFVEVILDRFFSIILVMLDSIPLLRFELPINAINTFLDILDGVAYFLPMNAVISMLGVLFLEELFKITLSFIKMVWKFIPVIGN